MNQCTMMGRLTKDPEIRYANNESQTAIANFSIAVDRPRRKGEDKKTDFFRCVAFGGLADFAENYLSKGKRIVVLGRFQNEEYENQEKVKIRYSELVLREIHFADAYEASERQTENSNHLNSGAGNSRQPAGTRNQNRNSSYKRSQTDEAFLNNDMDEELPFQ